MRIQRTMSYYKGKYLKVENKEKNLMQHSLKRLRQRYNFPTNIEGEALYRRLCKLAEKAEPIVIQSLMLSVRSFIFGQCKLNVIYDTKRRMIVTFLPKHLKIEME